MTDREPDYSQYTLDDLLDVQRRIDRDAYTERARRVDQEINLRRAAAPLQGGIKPGVANYERPRSWLMVVGMLGVLLGSWGLWHDATALVWAIDPKADRDLVRMKELLDRTPDSGAKRETAPLFWSTTDAIKRMANEPIAYRTYLLAFSMLGAAVNVGLIVGGSQLFRKKSIGLRVFQTAAVARAVLGGGALVVLTVWFGFPTLMLLPAYLGTVAIPAALFVVTVIANRGTFEPLRT